MAISTTIRVLAAGAMVLATSAFAGSSQAASTVYFKSPSGNIFCYMDSSEGVRCDAIVHNWVKPNVPSCPWEVGDSLYVGSSGKAQWTCHGDTLYGSTNWVLKYGKQLTVGAYRCASKTTGVRCWNRNTGHGFQISRTRHDRF